MVPLLQYNGKCESVDDGDSELRAGEYIMKHGLIFMKGETPGVDCIVNQNIGLKVYLAS